MVESDLPCEQLGDFWEIDLDREPRLFEGTNEFRHCD
jgi:hypothetical protein